MREINQAGIELIKKFEGLRLEPYFCQAGVLTIGYGHTGKDVRPLQKITPEKAKALLAADLRKFCFGVSEAVHVPLTDNQFAALVSFAFNVGIGSSKESKFGASGFKGSTLLKKLNAGDYDAVPGELKKWVNAGGAPSLGLISRRKAEAELWGQHDATA